MEDFLQHIDEKDFSNQFSANDMARIDVWFESIQAQPSVFSLFSESYLKERREKMLSEIFKAISSQSEEDDKR
ncbi:MAG: hypothetical protein QM727_07610 [Niabella sp.]